MHFPFNSENFIVYIFQHSNVFFWKMSESLVHLLILFFFFCICKKSWYILEKTAFSSLHVFPVRGLSLCGPDVVFWWAEGLHLHNLIDRFSLLWLLVSSSSLLVCTNTVKLFASVFFKNFKLWSLILLDLIFGYYGI